MKYAADFRSIARNALFGRWANAVITGLIVSLLGAVASNGPEIGTLFGYFKYWKTAAVANLLQGLYVFFCCLSSPVLLPIIATP